MNPEHSLLSQLNNEQQQAVAPEKGIFLVRAGAGSGKTRVITMRMANLCINHGIDPQTITALTFTNKAAQEMKERMQKLLPPESRLPYLGTFHSYCLRFLKRFRIAQQKPDFSILDSTDQEKLIRAILSKSGLQKQFTPNSVLYAISQAKNQALEGNVQIYALENPLIREIFSSYENEKNKANCLDFDDLLLETIRILRTNDQIRTSIQQHIRHLLVDEYQDTNLVQDAILKLLTCCPSGNCKTDSLCIVGDEDQSIYAWRGAVISNILNFPAHFPGTQEITLAQNYRSAQPILELANAIIKHNNTRKEKQLWSNKQGKNRIKLLQTQSDRQESAIITQLLKTGMEQNFECAVLYRSHHQSRIIEEALLYNSIPYQIIGGIQFYEREEVKDLLAYLRLINNPFDRISARRILNVPLRSLGPKVEECLFSAWDNEPLLDFFNITRTITDELTLVKKTNLILLAQLLQDQSAQASPAETLETLIQKLDYLSYLRSQHEQEKAQEKIENVKELISTAYMAQERGITTINSFLEEIGLLQEFSRKTESAKKRVTLMTLHAAKGLEFDLVILPGLEEGLFPTMRATQETEALEEERRLLYVGITRAREYLAISYSEQRALYGYLSQQAPSRFIHELTMVQPIENTAYWSTSQIQQASQLWLGKNQNSYQSNIKQFQSILKETCSTKPFELTAEKKWKRLQPIMHKTFGTGIITDIETKADGKTILTISFSGTSKKIDATFVKPQ